MQKLLFPLLALLMMSCATFKVPYSQSGGVIDYSFLTKKGMFVTESNSVSFSYEPLGSVYISLYSGYLPKNKKMHNTKEDIYPSSDPGIVLSGEYRAATIDDALECIYKQAVGCGANAIINLKISIIPPQYAQNGMLIKGEGVAISGMAIKK